MSACTPQSAPGTTTPPAEEPTETITVTPTSANTPTRDAPAVEVCPPMDSKMQASMRALENQVVQLRGLQPIHAVERGLLTPAELRERVEQDFLADYTEQEAERDALLLSLLGLIDPGLDLHTLYTDLLSEQVAGFYDSQDEEMLVVCGSGFGGLEIFTYVHEYVHALQDQTYDLEDGLNLTDEACEFDGERCFALQALIEGDATLLQEQWLRTFADAEILESLLKSLSEFDSPVYESAPDYIQAELTFPYLAGLSFTRSLYLEGDWASVDAAFLAPPVSSEQILHPKRYPRDKPIQLQPPFDAASFETPWEVTLQDVLGEWATQQVLSVYIPAEDANEAAAGWGGDLIFLIEDSQGENAAIVLVTQWDTMRDAHEFSAEFFKYGEERFGPPAHRDSVEATWVYDGGTSHFMRQSNQTRWIVASDGDALSMLQNLFPMTLSVSQ